MFFRNLSDEKLIESAACAIEVEVQSTTNVVRHFVDIYLRDLHLARGFGSMFLMAVKHFGYDKASAQRRVNAIELALVDASVLARIDKGELCLQSAADIQTFLNFERGRKNRYSTEQILKLVDECSGLSTNRVRLELASRNPEVSFRESKKPVSKDRMQITYTSANSLEAKLERIRELRSATNPYMNREQLLEFMAEFVLERIDPARRDQRAEKPKAKTKLVPLAELKVREEVVNEVGEIQLVAELASASAVSLVAPASLKRTRYLKAQVRRKVRGENDDSGCEFIDPQTGRRCATKHQLQFDHVVAHSYGGANDASNLQILCAKHNRFRWRRRAGSEIRAPQLAYV